jgi:hypothetical protein
MGLSSFRGNSGYRGIDKRNESGSTGTTGNVSVKKHFLERKSGNFAPIVSFPTTLFEDDFEDGTLNKWTVANATGTDPSQWVVGTATSFSGSNSAYISDDGGTTNTYSSTGSDPTVWNSHMWFDVSLPSTGGTTNMTGVTVSFDWKCNGENAAGAGDYDFGYVTVTVTSFSPVAGTEYTDAGDRIGATTNEGKFNDTYDTNADTQYVHEDAIFTTDNIRWCSECDRRIVFSWTNDSSVENQPPWTVDNVVVTWQASGE